MPIRFKQSLISQVGHFLLYSLRRPHASFDKGMLIVSTDVDVGSSQLGVLNKGKLDECINAHISEYKIGKIEELSIPLFVEVFDHFSFPITIAVRGQLTQISSRVLEILLSSHVEYDIGAHGYYHKEFTQLTNEEAEEELHLISTGMKKYNITPKSFIFPRNCVSHLDLLEKYNYICYRGSGGLTKDSMNIEKCGALYNVHPSIFIDGNSNLQLLERLLDMSVETRSPLHIWFHFWNFGDSEKSISGSIKNLFVPFLCYANGKREKGELTFETMYSATQKVMSRDS